MTLRDHRNQAKQWSYGRAQLSERPAHFSKRRTKLSAKRVKAGEREQLQAEHDRETGANDGRDK